MIAGLDHLGARGLTRTFACTCRFQQRPCRPRRQPMSTCVRQARFFLRAIADIPSSQVQSPGRARACSRAPARRADRLISSLARPERIGAGARASSARPTKICIVLASSGHDRSAVLHPAGIAHAAARRPRPQRVYRRRGTPVPTEQTSRLFTAKRANRRIPSPPA